MAIQEQTLHGFVQNLLNDATARADFIADPESALSGAGLGDITALDVSEVLPLVTEYGSAEGVGSLASGLGDLSLDGDTLDGAIAQLKGVADAASQARSETLLDDATNLGTADFDTTTTDGAFTGTGHVINDQAAALGSVTAGEQGGAFDSAFASDFGNVAGVGQAGLDGATGALGWGSAFGAGETTGQLGTEGLNLGTSNESVLGDVTAVGGSGLDSSTGGAARLDNDVLAGGGVADVSPESVTGDLAFDTAQGEFGAFGAASPHGVASGAMLGDETLGVETSGAGGVDAVAAGGSLYSPFGTYGVELDGTPAAPEVPDLYTTGDLAGVFDSETIGRGSEAAASTLATYMTADEAAFNGLVPSEVSEAQYVDSLPTEAPVPAVAPVHTPEHLPSDPTAAVTEVAGNLPVNADLPADIPADVPSNLPVDLPSDLDSALPELPVANPLPETPDVRDDLGGALHDSPVSDVVDGSPLGDLPQPDLNAPVDAPGVGDLPLGH
ncbi:IniB N-terminal domain-containing protein [Saccharomonospora sp. NPDC006951]